MMTDDEKARRRFERSIGRLADGMLDSPTYAAELEAAGTIVTEFPPSRYNLGFMLKIQPPDLYRKTHLCTQQELRDAESLAFHNGKFELTARIAVYRHQRFGADHPDGYIGELGLVAGLRRLASLGESWAARALERCPLAARPTTF